MRKIKDHFIICGYGRIGSYIASELMERKVPFVVIDTNNSKCEELSKNGILVVEGAATSEKTLKEAGIESAKGLVSVVGSDTENVFIVLTARGLCSELYILGRAGMQETVNKMNNAGANRVISPYTIGAERMVQAMLRPGILDFIETARAKKDLDVLMEEIVVTSSCRFAGETLADSGIKNDYGIIVLAVQKMGGDNIFNPEPSLILEPGDTMLVVGQKDSIEALAHRLSGK